MNIELFHQVVSFHCESYFRQANDLPFTMFCPFPDNKIMCFHKQRGDDIDRDEILTMYASILLAYDCDMYSIASESYFVTRPIKDIDVTPSEAPDRRECLLINTVSKTDQHNTVLEIKRNNGIHLVPFSIDGKPDGVICRLFDRLDRLPADRQEKLKKELSSHKSLLKTAPWATEITEENFLKGNLRA